MRPFGLALIFGLLGLAAHPSSGAMPMVPAELTGYLEPQRTIRISAAEPGIVQEVVVREGQVIQAGDILLRLDARTLEVDEKMAQEELATQTRRVERLQDLASRNFTSGDELLRAKSELRLTSLRRDRIMSQLERHILRSPIDGVVTEIRFEQGEGVPGTNAHVATVVQLKPMRVQFNLPLAIASRLETGDKVELLFPDFATSREGVVDFISPVSIAVVNSVRVIVQVPDPGGLPAGILCHLVLPGNTPPTTYQP